MAGNRDQEIKKLELKTPHYLASRLYNAREQINMMAGQCNIHHHEYIRGLFAGLLEANKNLAEILKQNGIIPTKYRIHYLDKTCSLCSCYNEIEDECMNDDPWDNPCKFAEHVFTFPFYSLDAFVDGLYGIKGDFKEFTIEGLQLMKVVKEDTNEVVWVYVPEEEDG